MMCKDPQVSKAAQFPHICNRKPDRMGLGEGLEAV